MLKTMLNNMPVENEQIVIVNDEEVKQPDYQDMYVRLLAEFDNYKKRKAKEIETIRNTAGKEIILSLITVIDDCEMAHKMGSDGEGIKLIYSKLFNVLKECGVEAYGSIGDEFNPDIHNAVSTSNSGDVSDNCISNIYKVGYKMNGEIIRHALVIVEKTENND